MLLRLVKSTSSLIYIMLPLAGAAIWWRSFVTADTYMFAFDHTPTLLYSYLENLIPQGTLVSRITAFLLLLLQGLYLLKFNNSFIFLKQRTLLPAILFIISVSCIVPLQRMHPLLPGNFFLLFALHRLLLSYKAERLSYKIFESSFLLALGSMFYLYLVFFIPVIWIGLLMLRPGIWREWVFSVLGFLVPWGIFLAIDYASTLSITNVVENIRQGFLPGNIYSHWTLEIFLFLSFKFLLSLIAILYVTGENKKKKVLASKIFSFNLWLFIITAAVFLLVKQANMELLVTAAVPVSFILSEYLLSLRSERWGNFVVFLLFASYAGLLIFY